MVGLERGKVELEEHREEWKKEYEREVSRLKDLIGDKILGFEHIGSTAIHRIKAKPIIDMIAIVEDLEDSEMIVSVLEKHGYEHRKNGDLKDRIFLAKGSEDNRTHYLSLAEKESKFYRRTTAFRDYLKTHAEAAKQYSKLKEKLAGKHQDNRDKYTEEKTEFIEKIIEKAQNQK